MVKYVPSQILKSACYGTIHESHIMCRREDARGVSSVFECRTMCFAEVVIAAEPCAGNSCVKQDDDQGDESYEYKVFWQLFDVARKINLRLFNDAFQPLLRKRR